MIILFCFCIRLKLKNNNIRFNNLCQKSPITSNFLIIHCASNQNLTLKPKSVFLKLLIYLKFNTEFVSCDCKKKLKHFFFNCLTFKFKNYQKMSQTAVSTPGSAGVHLPRNLVPNSNGIWTSSTNNNNLTSKKIIPDSGATEYRNNTSQDTKSSGVLANSTTNETSNGNAFEGIHGVLNRGKLPHLLLSIPQTHHQAAQNL